MNKLILSIKKSPPFLNALSIIFLLLFITLPCYSKNNLYNWSKTEILYPLQNVHLVELEEALEERGITYLNDEREAFLKEHTIIDNWKYNYASNIYAFGDDLYSGTTRGVFISYDNGNSWTKTKSMLRLPVRSLSSIGDILYAGTHSAGVFKSSDMGNSWQKLNNGLTNKYIFELHSIDNTLYALTAGGVFRINSNEHKWGKVNYDLKNKCIVTLHVNENILYLATDNEVFKYINGSLINLGQKIYSKILSSYVINKTIYIGTEWGIFKKIINDDSKWESVGLRDKNIRKLYSKGGILYAATNQGVYQKNIDGGNWIKIGLANQVIMNLSSSGNNLLVATINGIFRTAIASLPLFKVKGVKSQNFGSPAIL